MAGSRPSLWLADSRKGHALDFNHRPVIKKFSERLDFYETLCYTIKH